MPLQDLTPQLRTRLNRMERGVGWFIVIATLLLAFGFGYYIYNTAESRGWFKIKAPYFIYVEKGDGLQVGDQVTLMGFNVGKILEITPMPPTYGQLSTNNVFVRFEVLEPNYGYIWTEGSTVEMNSSSFLGARTLDIAKGTGGYATYTTAKFHDDLSAKQIAALPNADKWRLGQDLLDGTNLVLKAWQPILTNLDKITAIMGTKPLRALESGTKERNLTAAWNEGSRAYERFNPSKPKPYELQRNEAPPLTDRLQAMVAQVQAALPGILALTNEIGKVLTNATHLTANAALLTSNLNAVAEHVRPAVENLNVITTQLTNSEGSLGKWLIPTNINARLDTTLVSANGTLTNVDNTLSALNMTLTNVANITSNLNNQVQANTNILTNISDIVVHTDQFIQGLKKFWLFKHVFADKTKKAAPPPRKVEPARSPKDRGN